MAKDTLTAKFSIDADFETIQALRHALATDEAQQGLRKLLHDTANTYLHGKIDSDFEISTDIKVSRPRDTKIGPRPAIARVENGLLTWRDEYTDRTNIVGTVGSDECVDWLTTHTSFRYVSTRGTTFTAIKRADGKWYAHKKKSDQLKRRYLGISDNLTIEKMEQAAVSLMGDPHD